MSSVDAKEDKIKEAIQRARMLASKMGQPPGGSATVSGGSKRSCDDLYGGSHTSKRSRGDRDHDRSCSPPSSLLPKSQSIDSHSSSNNNNNNNNNNNINNDRSPDSPSSSIVTGDNLRNAARDSASLYSNFTNAGTYYGQAEKSAGPVTYQQTERLLPHINPSTGAMAGESSNRLLAPPYISLGQPQQPQSSYQMPPQHHQQQQQGNAYGSTSGAVGHQERVEILIPHNVIGLVIGKGGENIKRVQNETGANVRVDPNTKDAQGNKMCLITGSADAVSRAREQVNDIIENAANNKRPRQLQEGQEEFRMRVPAHRTGAIIGRGGETIRTIKQQSMCDIELDKNATDCGSDETVFIIRGTSATIPAARELIQAKMTATARGPPNTSYHPGGAAASSSPRPPKGVATGANAAPMTAYGSDSGAAATAAYPSAWRPVGDSSAIGSSDAQLNAYAAGGQQQPQQQQQQHGGAGDVAAWQAYYAQYYAYQAQGMAGYAGSVGANGAAGATGVAGQDASGAAAAAAAVGATDQATAQAAAAGGGQADYSAQWAEYYRALGYHKEAEAIEQNMKQQTQQPGSNSLDNAKG